MLQCVLGGAFEFVEFLLADGDHVFFGVELLAPCLEFAFLALIVLLDLVEFHLALFHLRLDGLNFRQALVGLALGFILDFHTLLLALEEFFLADNIPLAVGFLDNRAGAAAGHLVLYENRCKHSDCDGDHSNQNVD